MNWELLFEAAKWGAIFIFGVLSAYYKANTKLQQKVAAAINAAESAFADQQKAGKEKMAYAVRLIYGWVPSVFKPIITEELIKSLIQAIFDQMADYAKKQLDKATNTDGE